MGMGKILGVYQDSVKREPESARGQITSNRQSPRDFFNKSPVLSWFGRIAFGRRLAMT